MERYFDSTLPNAPAGKVERSEVYGQLNLPKGVDLPHRRPYTAINMVATVDGKVVIGGGGTTRLIGSETDHVLMGRIEAQADAVLLGANLIREDDPPYPRITDERRRQREAQGLRPDPLWVVVSGRGEFTGTPRVFSGGPANTALFVTSRIADETREALAATTRVIECGKERVDPIEMGGILRDDLGVNNMICLGGPGLNATMIEAGVTDELILTLAPKLQGGSRSPSLMEGHGYLAEQLPVLELLSLYGDGSELYLRYRLPSNISRGQV